MISALSRNITGIGQGQGQGDRKCEEHIIVDNSGTKYFINVRLLPKYLKTKVNKNCLDISDMTNSFSIMTYLFMP